MLKLHAVEYLFMRWNIRYNNMIPTFGLKHQKINFKYNMILFDLI
jgi:hypothetical protein